ncbi:hypothetical protein H4R18_000755 [Coemansia javaensis]|uniref:SAM-dependent MTase RsmB/NOP-type domain-containing protein n=1 Tax=Coemansia javaensis TaxID=2761396 RepID=A0A9W8LMK3_9FUNG|nr:hypothetical protein H4R18_000755 [Coemansia javaensis]
MCHGSQSECARAGRAAAVLRLLREDFFCRICGFNALSQFHLELHIIFYERAGDVLRRLEARRGSIKTLTVGSDDVAAEDKRRMYALICQTLKYSEVLRLVLERSAIAELAGLDRCVALVLVHDVLLRRGGLQRGGADAGLNRLVGQHRARLRAELERIRQERGAASNGELAAGHVRGAAAAAAGPRFVRVNLIAGPVEAAVARFEAEGWRLVGGGGGGELEPRTFRRDPHVPDVLAFPAGTELHAHALVRDGSVVLQDKASCMPAHVARPRPGGVALDACAAPGNKTSHMASLMGNRGRVFAFDKDRARLATLERLTARARCSIVAARCASFLDVDPRDPRYAAVECALVDPSCSGSGIVDRMDALVDAHIAGVRGAAQPSDAAADAARLRRLADFQAAAVLHAMRFPGVQRVSYSTCSVHAEENEAVVARVLRSQAEFSLAPRDQVIPTWPRRGLETAGLTAAQAASLVRALPEDGTHGFFVAGFVRTAPPPPPAAEGSAGATAAAAAESDRIATAAEPDHSAAAAAAAAVEPAHGRKRKRSQPRPVRLAVATQKNTTPRSAGPAKKRARRRTAVVI